ncbi:MAG: MBL fold metallo-hydrolase [Gammaproteobacteria bacterium]|nr:MBL fold metallo-hydrolase [Gammaproteobacteria bacterium]MCY4337742.1 MBL fold metallo-hydrolase [Gammaproteobacteria bacterium]
MSKIKSAASVILIRGSDEAPEVYLVRRAPELKFFGGYWVFPGGNVSPLDRQCEDDAEELVLKRCAVRELLEETEALAATLGGEFSRERKQALQRQIKEAPEQWQDFLAQYGADLPLLTPLFRIITPPFFPVRFDTLFLCARCPQDEIPGIDNYELVEGRFVKPQQVVAAWDRGEMEIAPPVLFLLRLLTTGGLDAFLTRSRQESERLAQGGLHPVYFSPGIFVAPLATPTLPPATTTNTLIAGTDKLYVIDPATPDATEQQRLFDKMDALIDAGATFEAILLTHHHPDHVGAVNAVSQRYRLPLRAHAQTYHRIAPGYLQGEPLADGDRLELGTAPDGSGDWHLKVLHTPGHAVDHLCFIDSRYHAAIVGDMLSTLSTIVIDPPEGHMHTYLDSLNRLLDTPINVLYPAHGPPRGDGHSLIRRFLRHRQKREDAIKTALTDTPRSVDELLPEVYAGLSTSAYPIAARSLLAGLIKLEEDGFCKQQDMGWVQE